MPPPPAHAAGRGRRAGSAALKPLTLSDWGTALFICLLFITACLAAVLAIHLNLTSRRSGEPILSVRGTADAADAAGDAAGTPSSGLGAGQQGTAGVDAAVGATAGWEAEPPRLSDQAEALSEAELHGGWSLTWEAFDRATKHPNATVVSWASPRVVLIRDFLSPQEIEHLERQATGGFERSEVVADDTVNDARTSYGSWLNGHKRSDKVREIQHRIHKLVGIPEPFGESIYVLQYSLGQQYAAHTDHCAQFTGDTSSAACREFLARAGGPACGPGGGGATCGDRLATVILYLKSPLKGGATVFPKAANFRVPEVVPQTPQGMSAQAGTFGGLGGGAAREAGQLAQSRRSLRQHGSGELTPGGADEVPWYCDYGAEALQVSPPPGTAVFFWDYVPGSPSWRPGELLSADATSLHAGCPVLAGEKLIATRWIRASEFF